VAATGCAIYVNHAREPVLIEGIDVDQSLEVAEDELEQGTVLTLWGLRDQVITPAQARRVSELYFEHVDELCAGKNRVFNIWHITWAISNFYRHGDEEVRAELQHAYDDAAHRAEKIDIEVARLHFFGDRIYMGDFHGFARLYLQNHLVVPGDPEYLQCYEEYVHPFCWCPGRGF
jgi:hypothetical protein